MYSVLCDWALRLCVRLRRSLELELTLKAWVCLSDTHDVVPGLCSGFLLQIYSVGTDAPHTQTHTSWKSSDQRRCVFLSPDGSPDPGPGMLRFRRPVYVPYVLMFVCLHATACVHRRWQCVRVWHHDRKLARLQMHSIKIALPSSLFCNHYGVQWIFGVWGI